MPIQGLVQKVVHSDDGTVIYADALGNPSLPSIVFIHGLALSSIVFEELFQDRTLLDCAYLVRYDLRGHGRSGKPLQPEAHESVRYAQDFVAVARAFNLDKPYLFGWSLGATIAADVLQHITPSPLGGIIYASPLPYIGPIMKELGKPLIGKLSELVLSSDPSKALDGRIQFVRSVFADPDGVDHLTFVSWVGAATYTTAEGFKLAISRPQDPSALFKAGKEGLPLLIVYSDEDAQINNEVSVNQVGPHFEKKKVVAVPRAGHAVFHGGQSQVVKEIVSFIGGNKTKD